MTWQVTWSLILGFTLSAVIEALVKKSTIARLLPDDRPRSLSTATGLGAASSSCSYAAVALARSLVRKGADFTAAMAFQFASTNLVIELGLILALLLGWQFTLAEFVGGPLMIIFIALMFRRFLTARLRDAARVQADRGVAGAMEGHAAMDMSVTGGGSFWRRLGSPAGFTSVSHNFVMEWAAILRDLVGGLLIAGAAGAWIPESFWQHLFITDHPLAAKLWGPLIGPLVAVVTFVCSIGNAPLAAVLWNGGISFGGVISFIFADLIIIPLLLIYAKYYGRRMAWFLFAHLLRHDGRRGLRHRVRVQRARLDPVRPTERQCRRRRHPVELHHRAEHRLPADRRRAGLAILHDRRAGHARHDGRRPRRHGRPRRTRPPAHVAH